MTGSSQPTASAPKEGKEPKEPKERKGFTKVLSRVKTALRRDGSSKRQSVAEPSKPAGTVKIIPPAMTRDQEARARYEAVPGVATLSKAQVFEQRAKKLGERYGLEIMPSDWQTVKPDETVLRVDKPIRMRIRRSCHRCSAGFPLNARECPNCHHIRCNSCLRQPPARTEAQLAASRERRAAILKRNKENMPIIPDYSIDPPKEIYMTKPSKTGGQELVYKKPRQRVRRTCHECNCLFSPGSKNCQCGHIRCTDCPRDPPKKDKYPLGYPGDAFGPNSVPRFECERCKTLHAADAADGTACRKCAHPKSALSPRGRPRKYEPELDEQVLKRIEERLQELKLATEA